MNLQIMNASDDDPAFIQGLTRLISGAVYQDHPAEVFLVRTDNWFDVKWFAFSGNVKEGADPDQVRHVWQDRDDVTIPPFVPHRIIEQTHFHYRDGSLMPAGGDSRLVHPPEKRRSAQNLRNRLLDHSSSALFIWFSSKSQSNGRASMMLYHAHDDRVDGWYVSFLRDRKNWRIDRVKNRDRAWIERMFQMAEET